MRGAGVEAPRRILESDGAGPVRGVVEEEVREVVVWHPGVCLACPSAVRSFNRPLRAWKPSVIIPASTGSFHQQVFMGCPERSDLDPPCLPSIGGSPVKPKPLVLTDNALHGPPDFCLPRAPPSAVQSPSHCHLASLSPPCAAPLSETLIAAFFFKLPNSYFSSDPQLRCELLQEALPD